MPGDFVSKWLVESERTVADIPLYTERPGARRAALKTLKKLVADHFVGEATVVKAGGYKKAAAIIQNSLPTRKRIRSGDFAELLASEYVDEKTDFRIPVKKLKWKSDRQMPMHGNDIIAINASDPQSIRVLKGECKSAVSFSAGTAIEAVETLNAFDGQPNPSTLAFITKRLYEENRDEEARLFQALQADGALAPRNILHLMFVFSGKDPSSKLSAAPRVKRRGIKRDAVGVVVLDHQAFIQTVYESHGPKS